MKRSASSRSSNGRKSLLKATGRAGRHQGAIGARGRLVTVGKRRWHCATFVSSRIEIQCAKDSSRSSVVEYALAGSRFRRQWRAGDVHLRLEARALERDRFAWNVERAKQKRMSGWPSMRKPFRRIDLMRQSVGINFMARQLCTIDLRARYLNRAWRAKASCRRRLANVQSVAVGPRPAITSRADFRTRWSAPRPRRHCTRTR